MKKSYEKSLGAYTLAAGAAAVATNATTAEAALVRYKQPSPGAWYDASSDWNQDLIMFKMDGTVVLNTADTGLLSLGQDADSFTFSERDFYWWGSEEKDATCLTVGDGVSANGAWVDSGDDWDVGRLGYPYKVGCDELLAVQSGRTWSDDTVTDTGGLGGWNFYLVGEWPFGGGGYVGLYLDDVDGRHYGWAHINMTAYWAVELYEFAFETEPNIPVTVPEPMTLSMLALGTVGLLARRKRA